MARCGGLCEDNHLWNRSRAWVAWRGRYTLNTSTGACEPQASADLSGIPEWAYCAKSNANGDSEANDLSPTCAGAAPGDDCTFVGGGLTVTDDCIAWDQDQGRGTFAMAMPSTGGENGGTLILGPLPTGAFTVTVQGYMGSATLKPRFMSLLQEPGATPTCV